MRLSGSDVSASSSFCGGWEQEDHGTWNLGLPSPASGSLLGTKRFLRGGSSCPVEMAGQSVSPWKGGWCLASAAQSLHKLQ